MQYLHQLPHFSFSGSDLFNAVCIVFKMSKVFDYTSYTKLFLFWKLKSPHLETIHKSNHKLRHN